MGERIEEVEVVVPCENCEGRGCFYTPGTGTPIQCQECLGATVTPARFPLEPGSLTAARLRLADAAEADEMARLKYEASGDGDAEWRAACGTRMAFLEAMNVVRALRTARGA